MNANEVIANRGNEIAGKKLLHPNDDINMSQSSNDTFPTAMHICRCPRAWRTSSCPQSTSWSRRSAASRRRTTGVVKSGRTHLQDATPIKFSQEISGWRTSLEKDKKMIEACAAGARASWPSAARPSAPD